MDKNKILATGLAFTAAATYISNGRAVETAIIGVVLSFIAMYITENAKTNR